MSHTTKILARLRDERGLGERKLLAKEAANEIERLTRENEMLTRENKMLRATLIEIEKHYGNQDMSHRDFRVMVSQLADEVLEK